VHTPLAYRPSTIQICYKCGGDKVTILFKSALCLWLQESGTSWPAPSEMSLSANEAPLMTGGGGGGGGGDLSGPAQFERTHGMQNMAVQPFNTGQPRLAEA